MDDWDEILEGRQDGHDGIKQQFAEADAYRKQRPQPRRQELHSGACYSSRFIPHIFDKLITAYIGSRQNSLDSEQEELAAEVSVKFTVPLTHMYVYILLHFCTF